MHYVRSTERSREQRRKKNFAQHIFRDSGSPVGMGGKWVEWNGKMERAAVSTTCVKCLVGGTGPYGGLTWSFLVRQLRLFLGKVQGKHLSPNRLRMKYQQPSQPPEAPGVLCHHFIKVLAPKTLSLA